METLESNILLARPSQATEGRDENQEFDSVHEYIKACLNADFDARSWVAFLIGKLEAIVWICASVGLWKFGNGDEDTLHIIQHHPRIKRPALAVAGGLAAANAAIFLYVQVCVRFFKGIQKDPELAAPWAIPSAACAVVLSASMLIYSCWGVWSWFTPAVGLVHLLALVSVVSAIPSFGSQHKPSPAKID